MLDDQPIGSGLGCFLFEYLADTHERRVFGTPRAALAALADFDPELAQRWAKLLAEPQEGLTLEMFDETAEDEVELTATAEALGGAIIAGCRLRLLGCREASLRAVRDGFTEHVDLRIQLGIFSSAEMRLLLRGNSRPSATDLLGCFRMPDASLTAQAAAGFAAVGSEVPRYLRELILDESPESGIGEDERLHVLEWPTALASLPCMRRAQGPYHAQAVGRSRRYRPAQRAHMHMHGRGPPACILESQRAAGQAAAGRRS